MTYRTQLIQLRELNLFYKYNENKLINDKYRIIVSIWAKVRIYVKMLSKEKEKI